MKERQTYRKWLWNLHNNVGSHLNPELLNPLSLTQSSIKAMDVYYQAQFFHRILLLNAQALDSNRIPTSLLPYHMMSLLVEIENRLCPEDTIPFVDINMVRRYEKKIRDCHGDIQFPLVRPGMWKDDLVLPNEEGL